LTPCWPMTHENASTTFDLPDPFGPTTQVIPGSKRSVVVEAKDLNPRSVRVFRYTACSPHQPVLVASLRRVPPNPTVRHAGSEHFGRPERSGTEHARRTADAENPAYGTAVTAAVSVYSGSRSLLRSARVRGRRAESRGRPPQRVRHSLPEAEQARLQGHVLVAAVGASQTPCGDPARLHGQAEPSPLVEVLHTE